MQQEKRNTATKVQKLYKKMSDGRRVKTMNCVFKTKITPLFCRNMWDFPNRDTYDDPQPVFSASRSNEVWGHCEMEFINATTAKVSNTLKTVLSKKY